MPICSYWPSLSAEKDGMSFNHLVQEIIGLLFHPTLSFDSSEALCNNFQLFINYVMEGGK